MKNLLFCFWLLLSLSAYAQIQLDPSYTYLMDGKDIGYKKGLKLLQSGDYVADIQDQKRQVVITETPVLEPGESFLFQKMTDLNGNIISPDQLQGKVVVLNYWFTGCKPCAMEIPELNMVVKQFEDEEVIFLAFANDIGPMVSRFINKRPFNYTQIPGQMTNTLNLGITIFPTHIIVNKEGVITEKLVGYSEGIGEKLARHIEKNL